MKIFVFSDSHGRTKKMIQLVKAEHPDKVLHLGDYVDDFDILQAECPDIEMINVPGNCDYPPRQQETLVLDIDDVRIFMTHGHRHSVKSSYLRAIYAAQENDADVLLFGHTHRQECFQEGTLWVMNPGAVLNGNYGILTIENGRAECELKHF